MKTHFFIAFAVAFCIFFAADPVAAQVTQHVKVSISGISDPLLKNVQTNLSIVQYKNGERLNEFIIERLYAQVEEDTRKALEPFGYYTPQISKNIERTNAGWLVDLEVNPGDPVRITAVDIRLTGSGKNDEELQERIANYSFPLRIGDILNHQLYEQGKKSLSSLAIAAGYRDISFRKSVVRVNRQQLDAQIELFIDTGPQYQFGETTFTVKKISSNLLQRMLPFRQGDPYSPKKIVHLRQNLLNTDYFSNVEVSTGEVQPETLEVPVHVALELRNLNKYSLGIGYGTDTGARGSLSWTNRMLNRYGHQMNVQIQPSERKSHVGATYTIPIYDPRKDRLTLLTKWEKEDFEDTETESRHASVSYDFINDRAEHSIYLQYLDEDYEVGLDNGHATFLYPGFKTTWRLADDRLKTKQGVRVTFDIAGASNELFSDATFLRTLLSSKGIYTFFKTWRLIGRFQAGWTEVDNVLDLSPTLRFYAGGDRSIRGYAYKSIGPEDKEGNVIGGSHLLTYSLEMEKVVLGDWGMAVFYDSGDAMNSLADIKMHDSAGVGIRWNAPFGQVRFDVAMPLSEGESSWRIHFNVGADL